MNRAQLDHLLATREITAVAADGFDDAAIGLWGKRLVYDEAKCLQILQDRDGMSYDDAVEYFDFNVIGGLPTEISDETNTFVSPIFVRMLSDI